MRGLAILGLVLASCASPHPQCYSRPSLVEEDFFLGQWEHTVIPLGTVEGPEVALPTSIHVGVVRFVIDEDYLSAELPTPYPERRPVAVFRIEHFEGERTENGLCTYPTSELRWYERLILHVDWLELAAIPIAAAIPSARVEPSALFPLPTDDIASLVPRLAPGSLTLTAEYYVTPDGCTEVACSSRVRVLHDFARLP